MLVNSLVFLESPTLKHIWIFYFYVCVELQLKCVENESYIFFRENVLAANKIWLIVKDFASDINLLKRIFALYFYVLYGVNLITIYVCIVLVHKI